MYINRNIMVNHVSECGRNFKGGPELSTELYEAKNLVFNLLNRTRGNSNLNIFWQYFIISILVVLNNYCNI